MKKLFIHQPFFRLLSPIFSGVVVYLLILLLNNDVVQLQEEFLGEELYACIGLSYITQEFSRALLLILKRVLKKGSAILNFLFQVLISLILCIVIVTIFIIQYYEHVIRFSADNEDLLMFNSIFCVITLIYILLFISHEYLYKINSEKLQQEELIKQNIEDDFRQFEKGINPNLLFESFEALLILMRENKDKADEFIDHLATIYRYILSSKDRQLVEVKEEYQNLIDLEKLFNKLPYRTVNIEYTVISNFLLVPGSLLFMIELIVRKTIMSSSIQLRIDIIESDDMVNIIYKTHDKINSKLTSNEFEELNRVYSVYSKQEITITESERERTISFPKLTTK
ncbi:MAG: histidine kinase [Flavobacteriaceae bacterium]